MPKIAFIGAGSFGFTRKLVRDVLTFPLLENATLALMDIDPETLEFSRRAVEKIVAMGELSRRRSRPRWTGRRRCATPTM